MCQPGLYDICFTAGSGDAVDLLRDMGVHTPSGFMTGNNTNVLTWRCCLTCSFFGD